MKKLIAFLALAYGLFAFQPGGKQKVIDVHLHGSADVPAQLKALKQAGVYKAAISTSWELQNSYRNRPDIRLMFGLMFPCPAGKVPYSLQPCYGNGQDWPPVSWVEAQVKAGKIDFMGEILSQYYGISPSDTLFDPYYALAVKYDLPVGIHTGGAGPDHGSPNFRPEMGNPLLLEGALARFPGLKVWIMHSGDRFLEETISVMKRHKQVYADISVISNPGIVPPERFAGSIKAFIEAGLEDRLMFGTDNGDIGKVMSAVNGLGFLSKRQKDKIFYLNAERFFAKAKK